MSVRSNPAPLLPIGSKFKAAMQKRHYVPCRKGGPSRRLTDLMRPGAALEEFERIKRCIEQVENEYDKALRAELVQLLDITDVYDLDKNAWLEFCRHSYWNDKPSQGRPKVEQPTEALRFLVLRACADLDKSIRASRIYSYYSCLRELRARTSETGEDVNEVMTEDGIGRLGRAWAQRERKRRQTEEREFDTVDQPDNRSSGSDKNKPEKPSVATVEIVKNGVFRHFLTKDLGKRVVLVARRVEGDGKLMRIEFKRKRKPIR